MTQIVNLTQHDINIADEAGKVVKTYPPSGKIAVCPPAPTVDGQVDGVEVIKTVLGEVVIKTDPKAVGGDPFPAPADDVVYIVGTLVAQKLGPRPDVVSPDTGPTAVREAGQVTAVRRFQRP